jgi:hypothetical protein
LDTELLIDPMSQKIMEAMNSVDISKLGIHGKNSESEKYYFQKDLNRVTIKLLFGKLNYTSYDKVDDKFKYNQFSNDEYEELLETKK